MQTRHLLWAACLACGLGCNETKSLVPVDLDSGAGDDDTGSRDASDSGRADCAAVVQDVLLTCGAIVCHDPFSGGIGTQLDLSRPDALPDSLFGVLASDDCDGAPYIDPTDPEQSLLIQKLDDAPPCGDRMPAGDRPPLDATERACFVDWVVDAAERAADADRDAG